MPFSQMIFSVAMACAIAAPQAFAADVVNKQHCMVVAGTQMSLDQQKESLLIGAKRAAVGEIFGELVTSFSEVNNFELSADNVTASSVGFVRVKGSPVFENGKNLGEVCVRIDAYATEEDKTKFKPVRIEGKQCASDASLTVKGIKEYTESQVIISALTNYNRSLEQLSKEKLMPLVHKVKYRESGFIPDTATYCAKFDGDIYPVQVLSLLASKESISEKKEKKSSSSAFLVVDHSKDLDRTSQFQGLLEGKKNTARYSVIASLDFRKLKKPLSLTELYFFLKTMDFTRVDQTLALFEGKNLLPKVFDREMLTFMLNGSDEEGFDDFSGYSNTYRSGFLSRYIKHLGKEILSLDDLKFYLITMDFTRVDQTLALFEGKNILPKVFDREMLTFILNGSDEEGFGDFSGYSNTYRHGFISRYIKHLGQAPFSRDEQNLLVATMDETRRQQTMSLLKANNLLR